MATTIHDCGQVLLVSRLKSGITYYDNGGNGLKRCPKCGKELNGGKVQE